MTKEKETKDNLWELKDKRFVAFIDILGFKDYVLKSTIDEVYNRLKTLSQYTPKTEGTPEKSVAKKESIKGNIHVSIFSDSIIILSRKVNAGSLRLFSLYLSYFASSALVNGIPLKGAVAYGDIYLDKDNNIFCGQALIDAYLLEEELQYMGIILHHTFENYCYNELTPEEINRDSYLKDKVNATTFFNMFKKVKTPLKGGSYNHLNLDFLQYIHITEFKEKIENRENEFEKKIDNFKYTMSGITRKYYDNTINVLAAMKDIRNKE